MEQVRGLADTAAAQIAVYPVVTGKEKMKRLIKGTLLHHKLAPVDPFSWPNAMLGEGLLAAFEATGEKKYLMAAANHLKRWKSTGYRIYYVDNIMNGSLAMRIEELIDAKEEGPLGAAEADEMRGVCGEAEKACAEWLRGAVRTGQGILPYREHHMDWLFADTLGMVCPFLCRYGVQNGDKELQQAAVRQLQQFLQNGMDERTGLPYHGYDEKSGMKYSIIGWGRACGWLLKGLAGSLPWIAEESGEYESLKQAFLRLAETVGSYQRPDGGFSWQLEAQEGHRDSSAEGMIGAALASAMRSGLLQENEENGTCGGKLSAPGLLERLQRILQQTVKGGRIGECLGECRDFAEYPQVYGDYPWGTGSALEFLASMPR
ncbi:MAG: glycoside hydrolase family 88 protein [Eubacteriales bacterium]|nr:glycoside hydrolase family 88 protein [Eubacteriales bacterium]